MKMVGIHAPFPVEETEGGHYKSALVSKNIAVKM